MTVSSRPKQRHNAEDFRRQHLRRRTDADSNNLVVKRVCAVLGSGVVG